MVNQGGFTGQSPGRPISPTSPATLSKATTAAYDSYPQPSTIEQQPRTKRINDHEKQQ
jgi:hypothetical protein